MAIRALIPHPLGCNPCVEAEDEPEPNPAFFSEDDAPLDIAEVAEGDSHATDGYSTFRAFAASDQAGTLSIEQSIDGIAWHETASSAVPAGMDDGVSLSSPVVMPFARAVYTNGGVAQGDFVFTTALV